MDTWRAGPPPRDDAASANSGATQPATLDLQEVLVTPSREPYPLLPGASASDGTNAIAAAATAPCLSRTNATPSRVPNPGTIDGRVARSASTAPVTHSTAGDPHAEPLDEQSPDGGPPAEDERAALLCAWQRSDLTVAPRRQQSGGGSAKPQGTRSSPSGAAPAAPTTATSTTNITAAVAAAAVPGSGGSGPLSAERRTGSRGWSPFEVADPLAGDARWGPPGSPPGRARGGAAAGGAASGAGRIQAERQGSTLLAAATAAGDLLTTVPAPGPAAGVQPVRVPQPGVVAAAGPGGRTGGAAGAGGAGPGWEGGGGAWGGEKVPLLVPDNTSGQLRDYLRDEQLRHAAESRSALLPRTTLKRAFMLAVTAGFLGAAIFLSTIPWGRWPRGGLPTWRWFLLVGCLPSVWYVPWFAIFLVVLLLESLLPVAVPGTGSGSGNRGSVAGGSGSAGLVSERAASVDGPAMMVYHILGVRRHMVRVLRSLCGQVLVHYTVVDYLDSSELDTEQTAMKAWTCLTLFLSANTLKSLVAKALSKHFHSRGYLERMQQAVKQELVLMALSRPRPGRSPSDALTHLGLGYHLAHIFGYHVSLSHRRHGSHHQHDEHHHSGPKPAGGQRHASVSVGSGRRSPFAALASFGPGGGGGGGGRDGFGEPDGSGGDERRMAAAAVDSLRGPLAAVTAAATPQDSRSGSRQFHSLGDLQAYGTSPRQQQPQQRRQPSREYDTKACERAERSGSGLYGTAGGGGADPASNSRWRSIWGWLKEHLKESYSKTKVQWELSRPSNGTSNGTSKRRIAVNSTGFGAQAAGGGGGGCASASGAAGSNADGVGADGLNYDQLRTSLFWLEQHIRRNKLRMGFTLTERLGATAEGGDEVNEVTSKTEAKRLAFYLHMNLLGLSDLKGRKYLVARDFEPFFTSAEEVREAFAVFDSDGDGRITLQNMVDTIVQIYKERKKLALTLQDTRTVVAKLELICGVVLHVLFGFSYLVIFQVNVRELWLTFSSVTLAFVFVFGNSIRNIYEAVLFLFVVHPFDVGDWLLLANGEMVKVEEIAMLFCTFLKGDGHRLYYPNTKLIQEPIVNVSRSDTFWDSVTVLVDLATPGSVVEGVEGRLKCWLADNPKQYTGSGGVLARALANPSKLQLTASWEYCHTGEDGGRTARWRSKVILVVASALEACGTSYTLPAMKEGRIGQEAAAMVGLVQNDGVAPALVSAGVGAKVREGVELDAGAAVAMQGV